MTGTDLVRSEWDCATRARREVRSSGTGTTAESGAVTLHVMRTGILAGALADPGGTEIPVPVWHGGG